MVVRSAAAKLILFFVFCFFFVASQCSLENSHPHPSIISAPCFSIKGCGSVLLALFQHGLYMAQMSSSLLFGLQLTGSIGFFNVLHAVVKFGGVCIMMTIYFHEREDLLSRHWDADNFYVLAYHLSIIQFIENIVAFLFRHPFVQLYPRDVAWASYFLYALACPMALLVCWHTFGRFGYDYVYQPVGRNTFILRTLCCLYLFGNLLWSVMPVCLRSFSAVLLTSSVAYVLYLFLSLSNESFDSLFNAIFSIRNLNKMAAFFDSFLQGSATLKDDF